MAKKRGRKSLFSEASDREAFKQSSIKNASTIKSKNTDGLPDFVEKVEVLKLKKGLETVTYWFDPDAVDVNIVAMMGCH